MPILTKHKNFLKSIQDVNLKVDLQLNDFKDYKKLCDGILQFSKSLLKIFSEESKSRGGDSYDDIATSQLFTQENNSLNSRPKVLGADNLFKQLQNTEDLNTVTGNLVQNVRKFKYKAEGLKPQQKSTSFKYIQKICNALQKLQKHCEDSKILSLSKKKWDSIMSSDISDVYKHSEQLFNYLTGNGKSDNNDSLGGCLLSIIKGKNLSLIALLNSHSIRKVFMKWVEQINKVNDIIINYRKLETARIKLSNEIVKSMRITFGVQIDVAQQLIDKCFNKSENNIGVLKCEYTLHRSGAQYLKGNHVFVEPGDEDKGIEICRNRIIKEINLIINNIYKHKIELIKKICIKKLTNAHPNRTNTNSNIFKEESLITEKQYIAEASTLDIIKYHWKRIIDIDSKLTVFKLSGSKLKGQENYVDTLSEMSLSELRSELEQLKKSNK